VPHACDPAQAHHEHAVPKHVAFGPGLPLRVIEPKTDNALFSSLFRGLVVPTSGSVDDPAT
jgi:hypothetical protein